MAHVMQAALALGRFEGAVKDRKMLVFESARNDLAILTEHAPDVDAPQKAVAKASRAVYEFITA